MIPIIILTIEDPDDSKFMEELYISYRWLMYSQITKLVPDPWTAEDILQTALAKLIDKITLLKKLNKTDKINYIITTSRRSAINWMRKNKRVEYVDIDSLAVFEDQSDTPEVWVLTKERLENTYKAWQVLDEKSKTILTWKYQLELTDAEIAEEMGIKPSSVRMALTRARSSFKKKVQDFDS